MDLPLDICGVLFLSEIKFHLFQKKIAAYINDCLLNPRYGYKIRFAGVCHVYPKGIRSEDPTLRK